MSYDQSNRQKTIAARLRRLSGGSEYIKIGVLQQKWFGLNYSATREHLAGVPYQPGGLYMVEDVASKIVQTEKIDI